MEDESAELEQHLEAAKERLHETLEAVNNKVERVQNRLSPERMLKRHLGTSICVACATGFMIGMLDRRFIILGAMIGGMSGAVRKRMLTADDESLEHEH